MNPYNENEFDLAIISILLLTKFAASAGVLPNKKFWEQSDKDIVERIIAKVPEGDAFLGFDSDIETMVSTVRKSASKGAQSKLELLLVSLEKNWITHIEFGLLAMPNCLFNYKEYEAIFGESLDEEDKFQLN